MEMRIYIVDQNIEGIRRKEGRKWHIGRKNRDVCWVNLADPISVNYAKGQENTKCIDLC